MLEAGRWKGVMKMWRWEVKVPGGSQLPPRRAQMQRGRRERQQDVGSGSRALGFPRDSLGRVCEPRAWEQGRRCTWMECLVCVGPALSPRPYRL